MSNALTIPAKREIIPPGFAERIRADLAVIETPDVIDEGRRRIIALRAYATKKEHKQELQAAERWCEIRLGELLPAISNEEAGAKGGRGKKRSLEKDGFPPKRERYRFRELAKHKKIVVPLIEAGKTVLAHLFVAIESAKNKKGDNPTCTVDDLQKLIDQGEHFGTIYADPPWRYGNQGTRAATDNHYSTMTVDEIASLPIKELAADNGHLHLWTTNAFLPESFKIMEAWGYEYKSVFVWVKPKMGIGNYWRVSHEFMLLGVRGKCGFLDHSQMSWLSAESAKHSRKPHEVRRSIEKVSPGPRLELFGRQPVDGWVVWGNAIERTAFDKDIQEL